MSVVQVWKWKRLGNQRNDTWGGKAAFFTFVSGGGNTFPLMDLCFFCCSFFLCCTPSQSIFFFVLIWKLHKINILDTKGDGLLLKCQLFSFFKQSYQQRGETNVQSFDGRTISLFLWGGFDFKNNIRASRRALTVTCCSTPIRDSLIKQPGESSIMETIISSIPE